MSKDKDQIQTEALTAIGDRMLSGIEVSMGVGKTRIGLKHMARNYTDVARFLIATPKKKVFESWTDEAEKSGFMYLKDHMDFTTYRSLNKQDLDYDILYLDECHSLKATHNEWLKAFIRSGGIIVGLTGTYPIKKSTEKGKMCNFYCPIVYTYKTDDAVDDKILNDYRIIVHQLTLSKKMNIPRKGKFGDFMTSEKKDYEYWSKRAEEAQDQKNAQMVRIGRMKALQKFTSKENYAKLLFKDQSEKTLLFACEKVQADKLCAHSFHSSNKSSDENLKLFKAGKIQKLSAVEQLSEGVNIPGLKVGIIMHSYGNNRKASQKLGRLLRLNPDDTATIHILCYTDTVDKDWVISALSSYDQSKITWIKPKYYAGVHY